MNIQLVTKPASYPVTLQEVKAHCRVDSDTEDAYLDLLISAATEYAEKTIGQALVHRTYKLFLDAWPGDGDDWWDGVREGAISDIRKTRNYVELPYPPLSSITHVKTYDDAGTPTTFASSGYFADTASVPGRLVLRIGSSWPTYSRAANGIEIQYVAGYGATQNGVPESARLAIMQLVALWYEQREPAISGTIVASVPFHIERILKRLKLQRL